jgi:hypothetical protein
MNLTARSGEFCGWIIGTSIGAIHQIDPLPQAAK